jgi:hypothetical protein
MRPIGQASSKDVLVLQLSVIDPDNGVIRATVSYEDEGQPKLKSGDLYLRRNASFETYWLVSARASDWGEDATQSGYYWGIVMRTHEQQAIYWLPNDQTLGALVDGGALPGQVVSSDRRWGDVGDVRLGHLTAEDLERIRSLDSVMSANEEYKRPLFYWLNADVLIKRPLFYWQMPYVFIRQ